MRWYEPVSPSSEPRLSAIVITKNEAHRIERCLRSVAFADEILVLDSGSDDGTVEIAQRCGARVAVFPDWPGFGPQKNRVLAMANGRWVLSIDADEQVDDRLRKAILAATAADYEAVRGYWIRRRSTFCGKAIRFGDWRRDRVLRLFLRTSARFSDDLIHERVLCPQPHGELEGLLLHDSVDSLEDALEKTESYARAGAQRLRSRGRGGLLSGVLHGFWTFVRGYLLRLGFLDGKYGLMLAVINSLSTYKRYRIAGRANDNDGKNP